MKDAYRIEVNKKERIDKRVFLEPLAILAFILGYCALHAFMQQRDQQAKIADLEKYRAAYCQSNQATQQHKENCREINAKLAVITWH